MDSLILLMMTFCFACILRFPWNWIYSYRSSDPGCVPMGARPLVVVRRASSTGASSGSDGASNTTRNQRALRRCHKCNDNFKPSRAHHDSVTGRCIVKFDHFCPWVGNAVGATNHKFFVLFVGYTMASCLFSICLMVLRTMYCGYPSPLLPTRNIEAPEHKAECEGWNESYMGLALLVISVVFFLFTSCMFAEQIEAIKTNASKIARMKMSVGQAGTELSRVTEEFNEMFGGDSNQVAWHWFLPIAVEFPNGMRNVVLGYEWDETFDAIPYQEPNSGDVETGSTSSQGNRIELTSVRSTATQNAGDSLTRLDRPQLVKRSSSSRDFDPDESLKPSGGTLT